MSREIAISIVLVRGGVNPRVDGSKTRSNRGATLRTDCLAFGQGFEIALGPINDLVAGCQHKAGDVDDSSASFAMFVKKVICRWIQAGQKGGVDLAATAATLLSWIDEDPYAVCSAAQRCQHQTPLAGSRPLDDQALPRHVHWINLHK
jgi:hypothetical protein